MADDYSIKATIDADSSGYEKGIQQAQKASSSLGQTIANMGFVLNGLTATFNLVANVVKKVTNTMGECTEAYKVQMYAEKALDIAIKNNPMMNGESSKNLKQFASDIQKVSNFGDEEIIPLITKLTAMGRTEEESMKIIKTATDMASTGTVSLETAINQLNMTMNGNIGRLGLQNAELLNLSKEELRAGKAVEVLGKKYQGMAQAMIDPTKQLNNLVGDLKETIGGKLNPIVDDFKKRAIGTVTNLISIVQGIDFTKVYNVFTNLTQIAKDTIGKITQNIKSISEGFNNAVSKIDLTPLKSVLDTILGISQKINEMKLERFADNFKKVFSGIKEAGRGIDFSSIAEGVNRVLDALFYLYKMFEQIKTQIQTLVMNLISNIWENVKEIFKGTQEALQNGMEDIKSWGDFIWSYLDNIFRIFQDVFNGISAILQGNWAVAWQYAKLAVLRAVNSVLDLISMVMNAFPKLINGIIDKINDLIKVVNSVREFFGQDPLGLVEAFEGVDLAKSSGLEEQIEKTVGKIEELTGKSADVSVKNIERISVESAGIVDRITGKFLQLADGQTLVAEKTQEVFEETAEVVGDTYEKFSEWDSKLLKQRQDDLEEYSKEYHEIQLQIIEEERKKAIEADKTGTEIAKINKYYDNEIVKENKRAEEAKREHAKETMQAVVGFAKKTVETIKAVYSKIVSSVKSVFSFVGKLFDFNVDDALENLLEIEDKILTFFVETLPKLPQFFASAVQSIVHLIGNLLSLINFDDISRIIESIITSLGNLITSIAQYINQNGERIANGLSKLVSTIIQSIANWITSGGWKELLQAILTIQKAIEKVITDNIDDLVNTIIALLPDLINTLIESIVSASRALAKVIKPILKLIVKLIEAIVEVAFSDEVLDASMEVIGAFIEAIVEMLIEEAPRTLPRIITKIVTFILKSIPKIIRTIIKTIVSIATKTDWGEVFKEVFIGIGETFAELGQSLGEALNEVFATFGDIFKSIGDELTRFVSSSYEGIKNFFSGVGQWASGVWDSLVQGANWAVNQIKSGFDWLGKSISNIFNGIGDGIKWAINGVIDTVNGVINGINGVVSWTGIRIPTIPRLATGTDDAKKGLTLVGEAGPELVRFNGGEQVLNNRNTNKALADMGGKTINQNITFNNLQDTTAFAMMKQLKQYNRELAFNGVL